MDWLSKIPNWVKIPIKILLPALAIFSGFIVLASDNVLEYLNLLEFEQRNGFAFAIVFLVCVSLIVCYIASYLVDIFIKQIKAFLLKEKMYKKFNDLQDVYKSTLIKITVPEGTVATLENAAYVYDKTSCRRRKVYKLVSWLMRVAVIVAVCFMII